MHKYYKMLRTAKYVNIDFYTRWADLDTSDIIKSWCQNLVRFLHFPSTFDLTNIIRDAYQCLIEMCYYLHGHMNIEVYEENWIFMLNIAVTRGEVFN